jgi:two-component system, NarL family, nitrate/nitrite response regulator NarL
MPLYNAAHTVRVLIADDHPVFREGLRLLLELDRKIRVVGEARDGQEAADLTRKLKPDLVLLDLRMPRCSGIEALKLMEKFPFPVRVLVLATEVERHDIVEVLKRGAAGIILKESTTQLLRKSIHAVVAGEYWVERQSISDLVRELTRRPGHASPDVPQGPWKLTPRERQIVTEVVAGRTNKEIAQELCVSLQTVKHHLTNIFDKVGVHNRLELALFSVHNSSLGDQKVDTVKTAGASFRGGPQFAPANQAKSKTAAG